MEARGGHARDAVGYAADDAACVDPAADLLEDQDAPALVRVGGTVTLPAGDGGCHVARLATDQAGDGQAGIGGGSRDPGSGQPPGHRQPPDCQRGESSGKAHGESFLPLEACDGAPPGPRPVAPARSRRRPRAAAAESALTGARDSGRDLATQRPCTSPGHLNRATLTLLYEGGLGCLAETLIGIPPPPTRPQRPG